MLKIDPTPEQLADAQRLKRVYEAAKKQRPSLTQKEVATACGWKSQGSVSQYIGGHMPLNLDAAVKLASALGCEVRLFSPSLAKELEASPAPINDDERQLLLLLRQRPGALQDMLAQLSRPPVGAQALKLAA